MTRSYRIRVIGLAPTDRVEPFRLDDQAHLTFYRMYGPYSDVWLLETPDGNEHIFGGSLDRPNQAVAEASRTLDRWEQPGSLPS